MTREARDILERSLLHGLTLHPEYVPEVVKVLRPDSMRLPSTQWWLAAIYKAHAEGVPGDLVYLQTALAESNGKAPPGLTVGKLAGLFAESSSTPSGILGYAKRIADDARSLETRRDLHQLAEAAPDSGMQSMAAVLEHYTRRLREMNEAAEKQLEPMDLVSILTNPAPRPPWVIHGWLADAEICILAGEWGSGKSLVAGDLALALAGGGTFLGYTQALGRRRVLYVDEENGNVLTTIRLRQLLNGKGIDSERAAELSLRYISKGRLGFRSDRGRAAFLDQVDRFRPEWIILDSAIRFFPGDNENDNSQWAEFMDSHILPLQAQGIGWVLLDHMRKPAKGDDDAGHRVRGASDKPGSVDELWCIGGERTSNARTMTHEKTRFGALSPSLTMKWEVSDDEESATITAEEERPGIRDVLIRRLAIAGEEGMRAGHLVEAGQAAGYEVRGIKAMISKLHGRGETKKRGDGGRAVRYWLEANAPSDAE